MQNRLTMLVLVSVLFTLPVAADSPPADPADGQLFITANETWHAFDAEQNRWVTPDQFWANYAERRGGLSWGKSREYPEYGKVKEFDTLLLETDQGSCLLMFFHGRWRRANDVKRWDDRFNDYSACPTVFE